MLYKLVLIARQVDQFWGQNVTVTNIGSSEHHLFLSFYKEQFSLATCLLSKNKAYVERAEVMHIVPFILSKWLLQSVTVFHSMGLSFLVLSDSHICCTDIQIC